MSLNTRVDTMISDQLKKAIEGYGSLYAVSRDSGVAYPILHHFMAGTRTLRLDTADSLCEFFGMRLTKPTTKPARHTRKREG
jgi:hypothetical protein